VAVFFSFHYGRDAMRVQQILQMGALEGQTILNAQDWQSVQRRGKEAIAAWIDEQMLYKTAAIVLIGSETASRPWVQYEVRKAWNDRRSLLGVRIHGLSDPRTGTDRPGTNPFRTIHLPGGESAADHIPVFVPSGTTSQEVHGSIRANLKTWASRGYKRP